MADRDTLVRVFEDTLKWIDEEPALRKAAGESHSRTVLYRAEDYPAMPQCPGFETRFQVTGEKSFQAACRLRGEYPTAKLAVLNFASATHTGGGVKNGARAQEESLCRCSTLYPALVNDDLYRDYYLFHRERHDTRYTDAVIYTPDVLIIKTDDDVPQRMPESDWVKTDIITCAAPNLGCVEVSAEELAALHLSRARHLLTTAAANGAEVLVLGAFGCGAFRNDPHIVAGTYKKALAEFAGRFRHVAFAVFHMPHEARNYDAFLSVFGE